MMDENIIYDTFKESKNIDIMMVKKITSLW